MASLKRRTKLFVKRVIGRDPWIRVDSPYPLRWYGDWPLIPGLLGSAPIVYSAGIGDDVSLELSLIREENATVYAFDPTPGVDAWIADLPPPPTLHFHPWALSGTDGTLTLYPRVKRDGSLSRTMYTLVAEPPALEHGVTVPAKTLKTMQRELGHSRIDLLKIDIEGAEFAFFDDFFESGIRTPQILVEFHHRFPGFDNSNTMSIAQRLRSIGYGVAHISETGREFCFASLVDSRPTP